MGADPLYCVLSQGGFLTYSTLCYKEIWVSPKIMILPSGTLSQTPDFENFATRKSMALSAKLVVVSGQAC